VARQNIIAEAHGGAKPLTSSLRSKKEKRGKDQDTVIPFKGIPTEVLPLHLTS
jgi:hypothetical protein